MSIEAPEQLNGQHQAEPRVTFGDHETDDFSLAKASEVLTIIKRDRPQVFAWALAKSFGIDLAVPGRKPKGE